jgi:ABC-2 type transport system permease protein
MPPVLRWAAYLVTLTYFLQIVRGIIIKGIGLDYLWPLIASLTLFGLAAFTIAVLRFRKRID